MLEYILAGSFGRSDIEPAASGFPGAVSFFWKSRSATTAWACAPGLLGKHSPSRRAQHGYLLYPTLNFHCSITPQLQLDGIGLGGSKREAPAAAPETKRNLAPLFSVEKTGEPLHTPPYLPGQNKESRRPGTSMGTPARKEILGFGFGSFRLISLVVSSGRSVGHLSRSTRL